MISYTDIEAELNMSSHNQLGKISNRFAVINRAIRIANQFTDLVGTERESVLVPVTGVEHAYELPSTIKENAVIAVYDSNNNTSDFVMVTDAKEFYYHIFWNTPGFENIVAIKNNGTSDSELLIYSTDITPYSVKYYSTEYFLAADDTTYKTRITVGSDRIAVADIYYEAILSTCEVIVSRYNRELSTGDFEFDKMMNTGAVRDIWDKYPSDRLNIMGIR
jgi:hypothetical protein